jgi:hypothetical protein
VQSPLSPIRKARSAATLVAVSSWFSAAVGARLQRQRSLADGRQHDLRGDALVDPGGETQALESGASQHHRSEVLLLQLAQPRGHVPAQRNDLQVRAVAAQLGGTPQAAGAHARTAGQGIDRGPALARHERIPGIDALGKGHELQSRGRGRREVLRAVDGQVGAPVEQRLFDLLHEQALAPERRQRDILQPIAGRLERKDLGPYAQLALDPLRDHPCLAEREIARARGDSGRGHPPSGSPSSMSNSTRAASR